MHFLKKAYHSKTLFMKTVTGKGNQKNRPFKIRTIQIFVLETSSIGFQLKMGFLFYILFSSFF